jgi:hypothetical protein
MQNEPTGGVNRRWKYPCKNHPDQNSWVSVGSRETPEYLCKECYDKLRNPHEKKEKEAVREVWSDSLP